MTVFGHIMGIPVEENLPVLASAAGVVVLLVRARLRGAGRWRRRR